MYRLMKSEMPAFDPMLGGAMSSYLHIQLEQFPQLDVALTACQTANDKAGSRHYVLNDSGKEYYQGRWID